MATNERTKVVGPGEGDTYPASGATTAFKVKGEDTRGMFELTETMLPPRFGGPPPHIHGQIDHAFYILEGEVEYLAADRTMRAAKGTTVFVPRGHAHKFSNPTDAPSRMLQIDSVGGRERMFQELSEAFPTGSTPDPKAVITILERYDTRPA